MYWDDGWHDRNVGPWWWLFMMVMMVVFWGGIAWVIVSVVRHGGGRHAERPPAPPAVARPAPEDILHERLARGEIDVDEYHQRVDALRAKQNP